ncbi:hypothetical protein C8R45DRAFT_918135 [Mycena sanguinolenta]|nr:hypothetical protein C8R45DRAFT_918135 [Mycena sanguinolenta]
MGVGKKICLLELYLLLGDWMAQEAGSSVAVRFQRAKVTVHLVLNYIYAFNGPDTRTNNQHPCRVYLNTGLLPSSRQACTGPRVAYQLTLTSAVKRRHKISGRKASVAIGDSTAEIYPLQETMMVTEMCRQLEDVAVRTKHRKAHYDTMKRPQCCSTYVELPLRLPLQCHIAAVCRSDFAAENGNIAAVDVKLPLQRHQFAAASANFAAAKCRRLPQRNICRCLLPQTAAAIRYTWSLDVAHDVL